MAGSSETPLARKLGFKEGQAAALHQAPTGFEDLLEGLPQSVTLIRLEDDGQTRARGPFDLVVAFVQSRAELIETFYELSGLVGPQGSLWVAWPKKASGIQTDVSENVLREVGLPLGMVDSKVCAIDDTWSGLRFVVRKENRPNWPARL